jgi:hypothetical protein
LLCVKEEDEAAIRGDILAGTSTIVDILSDEAHCALFWACKGGCNLGFEHCLANAKGWESCKGRLQKPLDTEGLKSWHLSRGKDWVRSAGLAEGVGWLNQRGHEEGRCQEPRRQAA